MRSISTLFRNVDDMKAFLRVPKFPINGFKFFLDSPENEPEEILEPLQGMNIPSGFVYEHEGKLYGQTDARVS